MFPTMHVSIVYPAAVYSSDDPCGHHASRTNHTHTCKKLKQGHAVWRSEWPQRVC